MSCHPFDGGRKVFGRYVQTLGIITHITFCSADACCQQCHQLFHDVGCAVSMGICSITLGMGLEDVVHHRQTEAAHQFLVELQMAVVLAVTKTMEVNKQMSCLFVCQFDDGVLIQRDTATDTVVVRRQQVLQELVVGGEPLHLHILMCREVADTGRHRYHHQVVLRDVVAMLVEHKTALARRTQQVHASITQFLGIHAVEVGGILKIYLHIDGFWLRRYTLFMI